MLSLSLFPSSLQNKIGAIIGPQNTQSALHVQSICDAKEMPHIETRWDPVNKMSSINLYPEPLTLGKVFVDLVAVFEWKSFTILYENGKFRAVFFSSSFSK